MQYPQTGGLLISGVYPVKYDKPPLSLSAQLALLEERGMSIPDRPAAEHYLRHINYYRLAGYCLPFESDHANHRLQPGTCLDDVLNIYIFDRELRLLLLDAIERVETSVRAQWAYHLSTEHKDAHAHLNRKLSSRSDWYDKNLASLKKER